MAQRARSLAPHTTVPASQDERDVTGRNAGAAAVTPRLTLEPLPARRSSVPPSTAPADTRYKARAPESHLRLTVGGR